jgi:hypothetical protein
MDHHRAALTGGGDHDGKGDEAAGGEDHAGLERA